MHRGRDRTRRRVLVGAVLATMFVALAAGASQKLDRLEQGHSGGTRVLGPSDLAAGERELGHPTALRR